MPLSVSRGARFVERRQTKRKDRAVPEKNSTKRGEKVIGSRRCFHAGVTHLQLRVESRYRVSKDTTKKYFSIKNYTAIRMTIT